MCTSTVRNYSYFWAHLYLTYNCLRHQLVCTKYNYKKTWSLDDNALSCNRSGSLALSSEAGYSHSVHIQSTVWPLSSHLCYCIMLWYWAEIPRLNVWALYYNLRRLQYSIGIGITPRQAIGTQLIPRQRRLGPKLSIQTDCLHEVAGPPPPHCAVLCLPVYW